MKELSHTLMKDAGDGQKSAAPDDASLACLEQKSGKGFQFVYCDEMNFNEGKNSSSCRLEFFPFFE